jgi:hypothetical protein
MRLGAAAATVGLVLFFPLHARMPTDAPGAFAVLALLSR